MVKTNVFQFICYATTLPAEEFEPEWDRYVQKGMNKQNIPQLLEQLPGSKSRYKYVSKHTWDENAIQMAINNRQSAKHFPQHKVKLVQAGGYVLAPNLKKNQLSETGTRLILFIGHDERDVDFYNHIPGLEHPVTYQAYYESCAFAYIMEYSVIPEQVEGLLQQLKLRQGIDAACYQECMVMHQV
jgi:hypothetical protein